MSVWGHLSARGSRRPPSLHVVVGSILVTAIVLALSLFAGVARADDGNKFGFDVRQPFVDPEATAQLGVQPGMKVVSTYVAVGNRLDRSLPFALEDITLSDENGRHYREYVTPIWVPALHPEDIGPGEIVGGYVSWLVPFYVWPVMVGYAPPDEWGRGIGSGWIGSIFTDVNGGHRYYRQIGQLKYRGAVSGYADGTFRPDSPLLRAQFAKVLMHASSPDGTADFTYPTGYLEAADGKGFLARDGGDGLGPLTRLEAARALARMGAARLVPPPADYRFPFTDVPPAARADVALLAFNRVVDGTGNGAFSPEGTLSRGQAAKMVARLLDPTTSEYVPIFDRSTMGLSGERAPAVPAP